MWFKFLFLSFALINLLFQKMLENLDGDTLRLRSGHASHDFLTKLNQLRKEDLFLDVDLVLINDEFVENFTAKFGGHSTVLQTPLEIKSQTFDLDIFQGPHWPRDQFATRAK